MLWDQLIKKIISKDVPCNAGRTDSEDHYFSLINSLPLPVYSYFPFMDLSSNCLEVGKFNS